MHLLNLPLDLHDTIVSYFNSRTLVAYSLTCKAFLRRHQRWTDQRKQRAKGLILSRLNGFKLAEKLISLEELWDLLLEYERPDLGFENIKSIPEISCYLPDEERCSARDFPSLFEYYLSWAGYHRVFKRWSSFREKRLFLKISLIRTLKVLITWNYNFKLNVTSLLIEVWRGFMERLSTQSDCQELIDQFKEFSFPQNASTQEEKKILKLYLMRIIKNYFPTEYYTRLPQLGLTQRQYWKFCEEDLKIRFHNYFTCSADVYAYYQPLFKTHSTFRYFNYQIAGWSSFLNSPRPILTEAPFIVENDYVRYPGGYVFLLPSSVSVKKIRQALASQIPADEMAELFEREQNFKLIEQKEHQFRRGIIDYLKMKTKETQIKMSQLLDQQQNLILLFRKHLTLPRFEERQQIFQAIPYLLSEFKSGWLGQLEWFLNRVLEKCC